jgi:hypothetical protein
MSTEQATSPASPAASPSPSPPPAPAARPRAEHAPNPRAVGRSTWQDGLSEESRHKTAEESRRAEARDGATRDDGSRDAGGAKLKIADGLELSPQEIRELVTKDAALRSRELTRPQRPEDFKFQVSPNFKPPPGLEFKLNENDPLVGAYRDFAIKHQFTQDQFTDGVDLIAAMKVNEASTFAAAKKAELGKLGATAPARIHQVTAWLAAMAGDKAKAAIKVWSRRRWRKRSRRSSESCRIIRRKARRDAHSDAGSGRIEGYDKMSFEQRRHAQDMQRRR